MYCTMLCTDSEAVIVQHSLDTDQTCGQFEF